MEGVTPEGRKDEPPIVPMGRPPAPDEPLELPPEPLDEEVEEPPI